MASILDLMKFYKPENIEIKKENRKLKLLVGKPNEVPYVKEFDSVEVIGTYRRNGEIGLCANIGGLFCPLVLCSSIYSLEDYDGVICSEYKTLNGFLAWCGRQIG